MDNDNPPTGFTMYLEKNEFNQWMGNVDTRFNKIETIFYGPDGTNGLIEDIHTLKTEWRTAKGLLKWLFGASAIGTLLTIINILKAFNII